jgi:hypothetical protein
LLEELAPLKDALERAVHRKNEAEHLKDQLEEEVRRQGMAQFCQGLRRAMSYMQVIMPDEERSCGSVPAS